MPPVRYSDVLKLRLSPEVTAAVAQAAASRGQRPAEWHRAAIRMALRLEGCDMTTAHAARAGDPEWALVAIGDPDRIVAMCRADNKPDITDRSYWPAGYTPGRLDAWVRVENCDSQPFDEAKHWREKPRLEIVATYGIPDRVRRVYPIVEKNWEHA
jgi:hypothetical protein